MSTTIQSQIEELVTEMNNKWSKPYIENTDMILKFELTQGRKYAKVVRYVDVNGQKMHQSVHVFVCKETGNVYKPATWAAPIKNVVRGNVANLKSVFNWVGEFGVAHA